MNPFAAYLQNVLPPLLRTQEAAPPPEQAPMPEQLGMTGSQPPPRDPVVIVESPSTGAMIVPARSVAGGAPEGFTITSDPITDPVALERAYADERYVGNPNTSLPLEIQQAFVPETVIPDDPKPTDQEIEILLQDPQAIVAEDSFVRQMIEEPDGTFVHGNEPVPQQFWKDVLAEAEAIVGPPEVSAEERAAIAELAQSPDGTMVDENGQPIPQSYWIEAQAQLEAEQQKPVTAEDVKPETVEVDPNQIAPAEMPTEGGHPAVSQVLREATEGQFVINRQGSQELIAVSEDDYYTYYLNDPDYSIITENPTPEQWNAARMASDEDFQVQVNKGVRPGEPEHGTTVTDIVTEPIKAVSQGYEGAVDAWAGAYVRDPDSVGGATFRALNSVAADAIDANRETVEAIHAEGYDRDGDGVVDVEAGDNAVFAWMEDAGVTGLGTAGRALTPLDAARARFYSEYADAVSKYATGEDMGTEDWFDLILGTAIVGTYEVATGTIGSAIETATGEPGYNIESFAKWARDNPDMVMAIRENGYDADGDGNPDFTGSRAVWEAYVGTQPWYKRAGYDVVGDPLSYTPAAALKGRGISRIGQNIIQNADTGGGQLAGRVVEATGRVMQAPYTILDQPIDMAFADILRRARRIPGLKQLLDPDARTQAAEQILNPATETIGNVQAQIGDGGTPGSTNVTGGIGGVSPGVGPDPGGPPTTPVRPKPDPNIGPDPGGPPASAAPEPGGRPVRADDIPTTTAAETPPASTVADAPVQQTVPETGQPMPQQAVPSEGAARTPAENIQESLEREPAVNPRPQEPPGGIRAQLQDALQQAEPEAAVRIQRLLDEYDQRISVPMQEEIRQLRRDNPSMNSGDFELRRQSIVNKYAGIVEEETGFRPRPVGALNKADPNVEKAIINDWESPEATAARKTMFKNAWMRRAAGRKDEIDKVFSKYNALRGRAQELPEGSAARRGVEARANNTLSSLRRFVEVVDEHARARPGDLPDALRRDMQDADFIVGEMVSAQAPLPFTRRADDLGDIFRHRDNYPTEGPPVPSQPARQAAPEPAVETPAPESPTPRQEAPPPVREQADLPTETEMRRVPVRQVRSTFGMTDEQLSKAGVRRYQMRETPFSEDTARNVAEQYDPLSYRPIEVTQGTDGKFYILSGHSRYEGFRRSGRKDIDVIVRSGDPEALEAAAWNSNTDAAALSPFEQGRVIRRRIESGESYEQVADSMKLGNARRGKRGANKVRQLDSLNFLPEQSAIRAAILDGTAEVRQGAVFGEAIGRGVIAPSEADAAFKQLISGDLTLTDIQRAINRHAQIAGKEGSSQMRLISDADAGGTGFMQTVNDLKALATERNSLVADRQAINRAAKRRASGLTDEDTSNLAAIRARLEEIDEELTELDQSRFVEPMQLPNQQSQMDVGTAGRPEMGRAASPGGDVGAGDMLNQPERSVAEQMRDMGSTPLFSNQGAASRAAAERGAARTGTVPDIVRDIKKNWSEYTPPLRGLRVDPGEANVTAGAPESQWHGVSLTAKQQRNLDIMVPAEIKRSGKNRTNFDLLRQQMRGEDISAQADQLPEMVSVRDKFDEFYDARMAENPNLTEQEAFVTAARDMNQYLGQYVDGFRPNTKSKYAALNQAGSMYETAISMSRDAILHNPYTVGRYAGMQYLGNTWSAIVTGNLRAIPDALNVRNIRQIKKALDEGPDIVRYAMNHPTVNLMARRGRTMPNDWLAIVGPELEYSLDTVWAQVTGGIPVIGKGMKVLSRAVSSRTGRNYAYAIDLNFRLALGGTTIARNLRESNERLIGTFVEAGVDERRVREWITSEEIGGFVSADDIRKFASRSGLDNATSRRLRVAWQAEQELQDSLASAKVREVYFYGSTNLDEKLGKAIMFHYWMSRASALYLRHTMKNPVLMANYYRATMGLQKERENGNVPEWLDNMIKVMTGPFGYEIFANPVSFMETFLMFAGGRYGGQGFVNEDSSKLWKIMDRTGFMITTPMAAAMSVLGLAGDEQLSDFVSLTSSTRPTTALLNALNAAGINTDAIPWTRAEGDDLDGAFFTDPMREFMNTVRDKISGVTEILPGAKHIPDPVESDMYDRQISQMIVQIAIDEGIIPEDLAEAARQADETDERLPLEVREAFVNPDSALWQRAYEQVAGAGAMMVAARGLPAPGVFYPYARPKIVGELSEQYEKTEPGTPEREQLQATTDLINARTREAVDLTASDQNRRLVGDENSRQMLKIYNGIKGYGTIGIDRVPIGDKMYTQEELDAIAPETRAQMADQWAETHGQFDIIDQQRAEQDAFDEVQGATYAEFQDWRRRVYDADPVAYWKEITEYNANARDWYNRLSDDQKENPHALASVDAFMAFKGIRNSYRDPAVQQLDDPTKRPFDPTAPTGGTGEGGFPEGGLKPEYIIEDIQEYQEEVAAYNAELQRMFPGQEVNLDMAHPGLREIYENDIYERTGMSRPRLSSLADEYLRWAGAQEQGADTSIEAWIALREQRQRERRRQGTSGVVQLSDGTVVDPSVYIGAGS